MKETCSQSDWRPACPEGHSSLYLVEFVSANVVWFSSSWILNRICNFTISNFQNNIFLDYKLLRYAAQASAITVFISGDENSSRKYVLSEYVHVAKWGWKTRISDNFTVLKWEDFFRNRGKVLCILPHNAIQTSIQPPSQPRLYDAWMATWLSRVSVLPEWSRSDFQFSVEYAKGNFYSKNNQPLFDLLFAISFRIEMYWILCHHNDLENKTPKFTRTLGVSICHEVTQAIYKSFCTLRPKIMPVT